MSTVLAIAGSIGSGKTTLADALVSQIPDSQARAFGDVVRTETKRRGLPESRSAWQETGANLIAAGWNKFVGILLSPPLVGEVLVVDGVRHVEAVDELKRQLPAARVVLVYVRSPAEVVANRVASRGENLGVLEHTVESQLPDVLVRADLVVDGQDVLKGAASVTAFLNSTMSAGETSGST